MLLTVVLQHTVSLNQQLAYYKEYQRTVRKIARNKTRSDAIFSEGIHLLSTGSSDFLQNYYINPLYNVLHTPAQFADSLVDSFTSFVQVLSSPLVHSEISSNSQVSPLISP